MGHIYPDIMIPVVERLHLYDMGFVYQLEWIRGYIFSNYINGYDYEVTVYLKQVDGIEVSEVDSMKILREGRVSNSRVLEVNTYNDFVTTLAEWGVVTALPYSREYKIDTLLDGHGSALPL